MSPRFQLDTSLDIDGNPVTVGDRLICIDAESSFHRLQAGHEYIAEAAYDGTPTVISQNAYHSLERFRLKKGEAGRDKPPRAGASRTISVAGGSPDESLTVPTQIAGHKATQREAVSGEPA